MNVEMLIFVVIVALLVSLFNGIWLTIQNKNREIKEKDEKLHQQNSELTQLRLSNKNLEIKNEQLITRLTDGK